mmetsp:Transcript_26589/g.30418  ORF Transcript_26589/g.30418 Transcript_26589/m.30418 type:complete len:168 (-) Transcript_26589:262-765(-)
MSDDVRSDEFLKFISSLEKHGSAMTGDEWSCIATDMGWSVDEVKLYAYWYMQALNGANNMDMDDHHGEINNEKPSSQNMDVNISGDEDACSTSTTTNKLENHSPDNNFNVWTYQECIFFDTLLATYNSTTPERWEKIAVLIPNKTAVQCRERYDLLKMKICRRNQDA